MSSDPMRAHEYVRQAQALREFDERDSLPCSTIRPIELSPDDHGMQVEWQFDGRAVVVTIGRRMRVLDCLEPRAWHALVDLRRDGVNTFRHAIDWLLGKEQYPPAPP
jgi:hypothetical protein